MALEIERKFLIAEEWQPQTVGVVMRQGYIAENKNAQGALAVRIRIAGEVAHLNVKSKISATERWEYEYPIPVQEAQKLLEQFSGDLVEKTRYKQECHGKLWEIDVFHGQNAGLRVAEVELESADEEIVLPSWVRTEVSADERYLNTSLAKHPYSKW